MSKIGRKPIAISSAKIEIDGNKVTISGSKDTFVHELPDCIAVTLNDKSLSLSLTKETRENKVLWGLHRALLANRVKGVETGFERNVKIVGLGYKAMLSGKKMTFSLGYSHKIEYELPTGVDVNIDKTGQLLTFKATDKLLLGNVCDAVAAFRRTEPYKGTGILPDGTIVIRKAGKAKSA